MTDHARRCCRGSDYRHLKLTATTAVVIVVAVVAAVAVGAARATTFESGETATVPPDDTVYMTEEVAAWNATAAAAGDYEYDDYDSTTADALQTPGGRYSPKPAKTVAPRVDANIAVPAATITVMVQVPTANVTNTTAAITTNSTTAAADTTAVYSTTTTAVRPPTSATTVVAAAATFPTTTTESGELMQIASPPGYGATAVTTVTTTPAPTTTVTTTLAPTTTVTTTPAPTTTVTTTPAPTTPNSSAPLLQYRRWTEALLLSLALVATVAL